MISVSEEVDHTPYRTLQAGRRHPALTHTAASE